MTTARQTQPSIALERLNGWRKFKDSLANVTITVGGMGVLMVILLIFFYLFYEILPLFKTAQLTQKSHFYLTSSESEATNNSLAKPLYLALEEQAEIAVQLNNQGVVQFFKAQTGEHISEHPLVINTSMSAFAINSQQNPLFALGMNNGEVLLAQPAYRISYPNDKRVISPQIHYPYGETAYKFTNEPIQVLAVRDTDDALVMVVSSGNTLLARRFVKEEDFLSEEVSLEEQTIALPRVDIVIDWLLIGPDERWLYVVNALGDYRVVNLETQALVDSGKLIDKGSVTQIKFLLGGISLMVADDQGNVSQWFMVREQNKTPRLEKIRQFANGSNSITHLSVEHRRKGFVTVSEDNTLDLYYTSSGRRLLSQSLVDDARQAGIKQLTIAPRANALLTQKTTGEFTYWVLENEHPDVSWSALWNKVWYESYSEPEYIWQSSASNNDFEPKYSFAPLAFGTLKAAFYAMLIAAPMAICGAIYTAYFMTASLRRKVKPLIELMEAIPTVILGFLAGLWLAPFVERTLPGVFAVFLLMPVGVLLFGFLWSRLPASIRLRIPPGSHAMLLIPVVIIIAWACIASSGWVELMLFGGDARVWLTTELGISFDQRNALIVGIAMGFAVIPTIFSIAEDAIYSVPKSLSDGSLALGATPWQTLVGVVIPTASPGIFSGLMIGMGRAVGETMIVLMATGNTPVMDVNIFEGMRTLAANIAVEIGETEVDSSHFRVLFLAAFVLFLFTFTVNTAAEIVRQRLRK
ncbi:MAG: ABC transporter permease subunit, partial [Spongiibacteraceae bacterium]|nr:ABC transporter permease subunit [Spongiibacteraceae bacterium]